ncbi:MAG: exoenzyme regulatory protein aepA, partial [Bacillota bacterium]|nr:exoenzyme regulatory protein aepA [Bacillota bacterium]
STTDIAKIKSNGINRIGGDIYIDGSFTSMSAAISFNYKDTNKNGNLYFSQDEINEFVLECYKNNLDTAFHAVGDRAVEQVLNAHIYAQSILPNKKQRHRIEHVELTSPEQKKKARELGIIFSMQPAFEYYYGGSNGMYANRLNSNYKKTNEFRKIFDEGIIVCGGSDSDLTPIDPILGIHAAVNHPVIENSISVEEAIKMFTINAAYAVREENKKGSIEIGKIADLVILDKDIYKINTKSVITTQVIGTIKNGKFLYKNFL